MGQPTHEESEVQPGNQALIAQRSVRHTAATKFRLGKGSGDYEDKAGALPAPEGCLAPMLTGWQEKPLPMSFGGPGHRLAQLLRHPQWMAEFTSLPGRPHAASTSTPLKGTETNVI